MRKIYIFIISCFIYFTPSSLIAQATKLPEPKTPLINGITVQLDIASVMSTLVKPASDAYSFEGAVSVNLLNKYFPILEVGFAGSDKYSNNDIHYKTNAPFTRIGIDFNLAKKKPDSKPTNNMFMGGIRLGLCNYLYDVKNVIISNNYWGDTEILNYNNLSATKIWYELVAGVKVEVIKNIYMGWTIRNKHLINKDKEGDITSWYIPGFGKNTASVWGFNYSIGYRF